MVVLRKRDTKGKCTTSPAGECPEYGPDAPQGRARDAPRRSARINPTSPGIMNRIVKASQGKLRARARAGPIGQSWLTARFSRK